MTLKECLRTGLVSLALPLVVACGDIVVESDSDDDKNQDDAAENSNNDQQDNNNNQGGTDLKPGQPTSPSPANPTPTPTPQPPQREGLAAELAGIVMSKYDWSGPEPRFERTYLCEDGRALLDYGEDRIDFTQDTTALFLSDNGGFWSATGSKRRGELVITFNSGTVWTFEVRGSQFNDYVYITSDTSC